MNRPTECAVLGMLLTALTAAPPIAGAEDEITAECNQEVRDYGIAPEDAADYVRDCVLSRGGEIGGDMAPAGEPPPGGETERD